MFFQILVLCFVTFLNSQDRLLRPVSLRLIQRLSTFVDNVSDQSFKQSINNFMPSSRMNKEISSGAGHTYLSLTLSYLREVKSNQHRKQRLYDILEYLIRNGVAITQIDANQKVADLFRQTCDEFTLCENLVLDYVFDWDIKYKFFNPIGNREILLEVFWPALQYGIWQLHKKCILDVTLDINTGTTLFMRIVQKIIYINKSLQVLELSKNSLESQSTLFFTNSSINENSEEQQAVETLKRLDKSIEAMYRNSLAIFSSVLTEFNKYKSSNVSNFAQINNKNAFVDIDKPDKTAKTPRKLMQEHLEVECFRDFLK